MFQIQETLIAALGQPKACPLVYGFLYNVFDMGEMRSGLETQCLEPSLLTAPNMMAMMAGKRKFSELEVGMDPQRLARSKAKAREIIAELQGIFPVGTETVACHPRRIEKKSMPVALRRFFEQRDKK